MLSLSASEGFIPSPDHVHWPNNAFPSCANLDVPHPVSFAACAIAIETGTSSILILSVDKSLLTTPYCLNFEFSQFCSALVFLLLFRIVKSLLRSDLILLFSLMTNGKIIWINSSFLFLAFSILVISAGNNVKEIGFTNLFFLTSSKL